MKTLSMTPWDLWLEGWTTAFRLAETMSASPEVVGSRVPVIRSAMANPLAADHRELQRMVSEKVEAMSLSMLSLARDTQAIQTELLRPALTAAAASAAAARVGHHAFGAAGRTLAPVHARATGNAKRLGRAKRS